VNWIGLQLVEDTRWMVLPMGAGLADGYLGVALFLAQLADLTGIDRYATVARQAIGPVRRLCETLTDHRDLLVAVGCGAWGLGGISYGLARMAVLLDDAELREWTEFAVQVTARAADLAVRPGWAGGQAGCLAAMTAVQADLESAAAQGLASECADRLAELVEGTGGRCASGGDPVPPGFAAGPAGVGWALARFAAAGAEPRYAPAGRRAVRCASELASAATADESPGWCTGTAGLTIARTCLADAAGTADGQFAIRDLADRPLLRDLSLCHGELGITEALTIWAAAGQEEAAVQLRHRAGLILDAISRQTRYCGTPGGVVTPGLLHGLAGIGYGLLRLGYTDRVPSALLLEPTTRRSSAPAPVP
jgi:lantibiotic modifying enzyme